MFLEFWCLPQFKFLCRQFCLLMNYCNFFFFLLAGKSVYHLVDVSGYEMEKFSFTLLPGLVFFMCRDFYKQKWKFRI